MFKGARIAVVIPAYNEAQLIGNVLQTMPSIVDTVVVVDDASTDDTALRVKQFIETKHFSVQIVRHACNRGVGAAIASGYRHASLVSDIIAVMAGDGQMDPSDLPGLLLPIVHGKAHYVKGVRTFHPQVRTMPLVRRIGTEAFAWATAKAIGINKLHDSQCGFTAIDSKAVHRLDLDGLWPRYGYPNDLLGQLRERGLTIDQVPVRPVYGTEKSGLRARDALVISWLIARAGYRVRLKGALQKYLLDELAAACESKRT